MTGIPAFALALALAMTGCGYDVRLGEQCPLDVPDCRSSVIVRGGDSGARPDAEPLPRAPLTLRLVDRELRPVQTARLGCDADCIDVTAVADGGEPPYAFSWSDGSRDAERRFCPASAATYTVEVSDSAPNRGSQRASLTLEVEPCRSGDAGSTDAPTGARDCKPVMFFLVNGCTSGMGVPGAPRLQPGQQYTVRLRGMLTADATVQPYGFSSVCAGSALSPVLLPAGQTEVTSCFAAPQGAEWLSLVPYSNDLSVFMDGLRAELCTGCD